MNSGKLLLSLTLFIAFLSANAQISIDPPQNIQKGIVYLKGQTTIKEEVPLDLELLPPKVKTLRVHQPSVTNYYRGSETEGHAVLFPDEYAAFEINLDNQEVSFIKPDYDLNAKSLTALNRVPDWLYEDLLMKFRILRKYYLDDDFAELIIQADENVVDEVAFQIAHIALNTLKDARLRFQPDMIIDGAKFIYDVVDSLQYVRLKEYGTYAGRDYYTTTEYRIVVSPGDTQWKELPYEYYYWYVVHPKLYQEGIYEKDNTSSTQQRTYGYFWREFLWYNPDPNHDYTQVNKTGPQGTITTIPRLGEVIKNAKVLWERKEKYYIFKRSFDNTYNALDILGNWASQCVPVDAELPRAIQPNQVAIEHDGNCGEDTYILGAASRTALVPFLYTGSSGEDHVWGMIWDEDWYHYEFFRGGLERSGWGFTSTLKGGSYESSNWTMSMVEGFRPDGYNDIRTEYYTDVAELTVYVTDKDGNPLDGAAVIFWCKPGPYYNQGWQKSAYQYTDHAGKVMVKIGDQKEYGVQIRHPQFGIRPSPDKLWPVISPTKAVKGESYEATVKFDNATAPLLAIDNALNLPQTADYGIQIQFDAQEVIAGVNDRDIKDPQFAYRIPDQGAVSFFVCDETNYQKFINDQGFEAYNVYEYIINGTLTLPLAASGKWYAVMSNNQATVNYEYLKASCSIVNDPNYQQLQTESDNYEIRVYPNPSISGFHIATDAEIQKVEIFDTYGQLIGEIQEQPFQWFPETYVQKGTYLLRISGDGFSEMKRVVLF